MTPKERAAVQRLIDLTAEICEYRYSDEIEQAYSDVREALAEPAEQEPIELVGVKEAIEESLTAEPLRFGCLYPGGRLEVFKTRKRAQEYVDGSLRNGADVKLIELYAAADREKNK